MPDGTGSSQPGNHRNHESAARRPSSREINGVLVTHEWMSLPREHPSEQELQSVEVAAAGGEGTAAGEASYTIFELCSGGFAYSIWIDGDPGLEHGDEIRRPFASQEEALIKLADELLTFAVNVQRAQIRA